MTMTKGAIAKFAGVAVLTGVVLALAAPAEAAKKRKTSRIYYGHEETHVQRSHGGTRIVVRRRSYLHPGTETKQYDDHDSDYAFPPTYTVTGADPTDPKIGFNRMPFPSYFDLPRAGRY